MKRFLTIIAMELILSACNMTHATDIETTDSVAVQTHATEDVA